MLCNKDLLEFSFLPKCLKSYGHLKSICTMGVLRGFLGCFWPVNNILKIMYFSTNQRTMKVMWPTSNLRTPNLSLSNIHTLFWNQLDVSEMFMGLTSFPSGVSAAEGSGLMESRRHGPGGTGCLVACLTLKTGFQDPCLPFSFSFYLWVVSALKKRHHL